MKSNPTYWTASRRSGALSLDHLTIELKILIAEHLYNDVASLCSLSLVSRSFQEFVEPIIYRRVSIRKGNKCQILLRSIESRQQRAESIHAVSAKYQYEHLFLPKYMARLLRQASNLRELSLESPYSRYRNWTSEMYWSSAKAVIFQPLLEAVPCIYDPLITQRPLQALKKLTLYWRDGGSQYWSVAGGYGAIFVHPSLVYLEISSANIDDDVLNDFRGQKSTPLKSLVLVECIISLPGLHSILSKPEALETFFLSENRELCKTSPLGFSNLATRDHVAFFATLSQQRHSLRTLTYHNSPVSLPLPRIAVSCESFAEFTMLEDISIEASCDILLDVIVHPSTSPPNLVNICLWGSTQEHGIEIMDLEDFEPEDYARLMFSRHKIEQRSRSLAYLKRLQKARFVVRPEWPDPTDLFRHQVIETLGKEFQSMRKHFVVVSHWSDDTFPPYMEHKGLKCSEVIFDSALGGWMPDITSREEGQERLMQSPPSLMMHF